MKKEKTIITTRELGKYILENKKVPIPVYIGRGYKEAKRSKGAKF